MKTLKKIWSGPWSVKLSFIFLAFILLCMFIGNPGQTIFMILFFASAIRLFNWLTDDE